MLSGIQQLHVLLAQIFQVWIHDSDGKTHEQICDTKGDDPKSQTVVRSTAQTILEAQFPVYLAPSL